MPLQSSKGLFKGQLFGVELYAPGEFRGTGVTVIPQPIGLPGLGGGVSPGFDFEGFLNQFGTPPAAWLAPPAPPALPITTEYIGAGAPTAYLGGFGGLNTAVVSAGSFTVISVEGTIGYAHVGKLVSQAPAGTV